MSEQLHAALASCTLDEKRKVFVELAKQLLAATGERAMPLQDEQANVVGYLTTAAGPAAFFPSDPAWIAEMQRRAENPGKTYSVEEFFTELKRRRALQAKG